MATAIEIGLIAALVGVAAVTVTNAFIAQPKTTNKSIGGYVGLEHYSSIDTDMAHPAGTQPVPGRAYVAQGGVYFQRGESCTLTTFRSVRPVTTDIPCSHIQSRSSLSE